MAEAQQVIAVVLLGVVAIVGIAVLSPLAGVATDMGTSAGNDTIDEPGTGVSYSLDTSLGSDGPSQFSVAPTREHAIALDGDGYLEDNVSVVEEDHWSVAVTAALDDSANEQATYTILAVDNASVLVEYRDGEYRAINYEGDDSAVATVSAPNPASFAGVVVSWDGTAETLTLYTADGSDSGSLTAEHPDRNVANDWVGTIDELRFFNATVDQQTATSYADDPIQPLAGTDEHARYMFNEGSGSSTTAYYSGSTATLVGASWTSGVEAPDLEEGVDYSVGTSPLSITVLEDGYLEGAPILYVSWDSGLGGTFGSIIGGVGGAMQLVPILMLVMLAGVLIAVMARFN